jgi:sugar phosphate isomerase/epimerase
MPVPEIGADSASTAPTGVADDPGGAAALPGIALQLYTVRQQMAEDPGAALAEVAAAGYEAVELVEHSRVGVETLRPALTAAGLHVVGSHVPHEELQERLDAVLEEIAVLGGEYLVVQQARQEDWADAESVRRLAERLNGWAQRTHAAGLRFAYHGYHPVELEFAALAQGTMYDLMVAETDPQLVEMQVDTYWVHQVGRDPVATLRAYAQRSSTLHLKDVAPGVPVHDTPVGDGIIDWPSVLRTAVTQGVRWLIVEQEDDPEHALRDSRRSLEQVRALLGAAKGVRAAEDGRP